MIYDCFTLFNEFDVLEIRLNVLNDVVDKFVIVEGDKTHSGLDKPLYFKQVQTRFEKFKDKIIYIAVEDFPPYNNNSWEYENYQRNCIAIGLTKAKPDDIILVSDLDEIPRPEKILEYKDQAGIVTFEQDFFYYFLNCKGIPGKSKKAKRRRQGKFLGTRMMSYKDFLHGLDNVDLPETEYYIKKYCTGTTATKIRQYDKGVIIKDGGWHFSYLGGVEAIIKKIKAFGHQEFNSEKFTDANKIRKLIESGRDIFGRKQVMFEFVKIDDSYPKYIIENKEKYDYLVFKPSKWYKFKRFFKNLFR